MCVVPITGSPPIPTAVENPMSRSSYIIWYVSVPDLDTSPSRPSAPLSAGIIPAFDVPGEGIPGRFGATVRVVCPRAPASTQNTAVSCTGMPSVITMTSGTRASMASITAAFVPAGGTNTTETSAPVAATVSATVPNTGTAVPPRSTVWPALRGLVPPTTLVPAAIMRAPCLLPSEPVMPWTMIRFCAVRKIAISCSRRGQAGQLGGTPRRLVHSRYLLDDSDARLGEDPAAFSRVVAVEPDHDRKAHLLAPLGEDADRSDNPDRHLVARGDAAEDINQDRANRGIGEHDVEAVCHDLG